MHATRFLVCAAYAFLAGCAASTSSEPSRYPGYALADPNDVVRTGTGDCLRAGTPDPSVIVGECEPERLARQSVPAEPTPPESVAQPAPPEPAAVTPPQEPEVATSPATESTELAPREAPAQAEQSLAPEGDGAGGKQLAVVPPPEPATPPAPEQVLERIVLGTDAYFGFDQDELTDRARQKLDRVVVERARNADEMKIRIVGHADRIGEADYNLKLSQRRADAVRTYLIEQGIDETAIEVDARGETDPIVQCEGRSGARLIDCLQVNRRSEIEFTALEPVDR